MHFLPWEAGTPNYYLLTTLYAVFVLLFSLNITWKGAAFYAIGGYILEHLAANLYLAFAALLGIYYRDMWYQIVRFILLVLLVCIYQGLIKPRIRSEVREVNLGSSQLLAFLTIAIILTNLLTTWIYHTEGGDLSGHPGYLIYGIFSSVLLFVIQYGMINLTEAVNDKQVLNNMMREMDEQYRISKETVDALNAKYHDFKYRILDLTREGAGKDYWTESLELVEHYQSAFQTGNEALNILLTQKSAVCRRKGIDLTCIADGAALGFMEPADIYALFGNALDNAIEALDSIGDHMQKMISLNVSVKGRFLVIGVENPCDKTVNFTGGLPITTKSDKTSHGIGTKSIKFIAEKYAGNAVMQCENGIFSVNVMIPIIEK